MNNPSPPPADDHPENSLNWIWVGAGFVLVLLTGAVVWLAVMVADLRSDVQGELEIVQIEVPASDPAPVPPVKRPQFASNTTDRKFDAPKKKPSEIDAPSVADVEIKRMTAGELGIPGLPPDREVEVIMDGAPSTGRDAVGTEDGFVSREAFEKEGYKMAKFPLTREESAQRMAEMFPKTTTPLTPDEVEEFLEVGKSQLKSEAALMHLFREDAGTSEIPQGFRELFMALETKWERVSPNSSDEDFAKADAEFLRAAERSLTPSTYARLKAKMDSGEDLSDFPSDEAGAQDMAWAVRSLLNNGMKRTINDWRDMMTEVHVPPPPPGISKDNPDYKRITAEYIAEKHKGYEQDKHRRPDSSAAPPPSADDSQDDSTP
jgi:hypothetical protein